MTNQQILTKAIDKAIAGGWYSFANDAFGKITIDDILIRYNEHGQGLEWTVKGHESNWSLIEALIYSHDFAKALWGNAKIGGRIEGMGGTGNIKTEVWTVGGTPAWQYHLQNMVIADDPIKYLGENLPQGEKGAA